jgi:hypothetical protein
MSGDAQQRQAVGGNEENLLLCCRRFDVPITPITRSSAPSVPPCFKGFDSLVVV